MFFGYCEQAWDLLIYEHLSNYLYYSWSGS